MLCIFAWDSISTSGYGKVYPENLNPLLFFCVSVYVCVSVYATLVVPEISIWEINMDSDIEPIIYFFFLAETNQNQSAKTLKQPKAQGIQKKDKEVKYNQNTQGKEYTE